MQYELHLKLLIGYWELSPKPRVSGVSPPGRTVCNQSSVAI